MLAVSYQCESLYMLLISIVRKKGFRSRARHNSAEVSTRCKSFLGDVEIGWSSSIMFVKNLDVFWFSVGITDMTTH